MRIVHHQDIVVRAGESESGQIKKRQDVTNLVLDNALEREPVTCSTQRGCRRVRER